jgi:hypothetical protein
MLECLEVFGELAKFRELSQFLDKIDMELAMEHDTPGVIKTFQQMLQPTKDLNAAVMRITVIAQTAARKEKERCQEVSDE